MKRSVIVFLILVMALGAISCARADAVNKADTAPEAAEVSAIEAPEEVNAQSAPQEVQSEEPVTKAQTYTTIGVTEAQVQQAQGQVSSAAVPEDEGCTIEANGYKLEVVSASVEKDYVGNTIAVVKIIFTNNNQSSAQYWSVALASAKQNGATLVNNGQSGPILADEKFYNCTQEISGGQSIPIYEAFLINDTSTPIEFTGSICVASGGAMTPVSSGSCTLSLS